MNDEHQFFCKLHIIKWPKFVVKTKCFSCKHFETLAPVLFVRKPSEWEES